MSPIQEANIVALLVQAILYGVYLVLVIFTLRCLMFDDKGWKLRRKPNGLMLAVTSLFFVFSTSDLLLSLLMSTAAVRGQTTTYNRYGIVNNTVENTTILIADAVLIYRCWLVYAKSWRVTITPVLLWLASLSCSVLVICSQITAARESKSYYLWVVFYFSNILTNIYATAAIICRISKVENDIWHQQSRLHKTSRILFECGFLYTLTSSMNLVSSIVSGPPIIRYISDAVNFSMTGITFNLIIIRVYQQRRDVTDTGTDTRNDSSARIPLSSTRSELSTPTTTARKESYDENQDIACTASLDFECGSKGIWQGSTYTSSNKYTKF